MPQSIFHEENKGKKRLNLIFRKRVRSLMNTHSSKRKRAPRRDERSMRSGEVGLNRSSFEELLPKRDRKHGTQVTHSSSQSSQTLVYENKRRDNIIE
jgi:hypothetical protein